MKQILLQLYFNFFKYLAKIYILRNSPYVIGITGSIGKTGARMIISEILKNNLEEKVIYTSDKNFNGELGLSLSILGISDYKPTLESVIQTIFKALKTSLFSKKLYDIVVLEYGIDHPGEMDFLLSIVKPNIGIVTKIDKVHSLQFSSKDVIASEKYKLLINSRDFSFLNFDDEYSKIYQKEIKNKIYYTTNTSIDSNLGVYGDNYELKENLKIPYSVFDLYIEAGKKASISSNLIGIENVGYISISYKILDIIYEKLYKKSFFGKNYSDYKINFKLQPGRFGIFSGINDSVIIDSTYNAAPLSTRKIISNVLNIKDSIYSDYNTIFCLGEMRELGDYTREEHESLAEFVFDKCDFVFVVGKSMKEYFLPKILNLGFSENNVKFFNNSFEMGEYLRNFLQQSTEKNLILFKGSQNTIFLEEAIKYILKYKSDESFLCRQDSYWLEKKGL